MVLNDPHVVLHIMPLLLFLISYTYQNISLTLELLREKYEWENPSGGSDKHLKD